jgi:ABC-type transport system substrate-binding protein
VAATPNRSDCSVRVSARAPASPTPTPVPTERAFDPEAWPAEASACGTEGYRGLLGRIEASAARTVRFTLCGPDGAFPARLAHPALGILDAVMAERVAGDPDAVREAAGAGPFRIASWSPGDNVQLERVPGGTADGVPTVVLRWSPSATRRDLALQDAEVDGIDDPAASDLDGMSTLPELAILERAGLATAYLGFGAGHDLGQATVRRAFAQGVDRDSLARDAVEGGTAAADYLAPCPVLGGCAGTPWYAFNGPAGFALLDDAGFDRKIALPLHVPDSPVAGIPDPARLGAALRGQLADSLDVRVKLVTEPAADIAAAAAARELDGLYLAAITSPVADASGYLGPLFGPGNGSLTAQRGKAVRQALAAAAPVTDRSEREAALGDANDALRSAVPLVPLVHTGALAVWRSDVGGVAISPIGADPLGSFVPADRGQVVVMGADEPAGSWCGITTALDAVRLCALVTTGLFAFEGATLTPVPALASGCTPSDDARTWTCRLRQEQAFAGGARVDAADVLATFRVLADPASPLRSALPPEAFAAWDGLFGGPLPAAPAP